MTTLRKYLQILACCSALLFFQTEQSLAAENPSAGAVQLPKTLVRIQTSKTINQVDLMGRGQPLDLIVTGEADSPVVSNPLIFMVYINTGTMEKEHYHMVWMPKIYEKGSEYYVFSSSAMNCFDAESSFFQGKVNGRAETFLLLAKSQDHATGGPITIDVYQLMPAAPPAADPPVGSPFSFERIEHVEKGDSACSSEDLAKAEQRDLGVKFVE
jgi:hypothetical protein